MSTETISEFGVTAEFIKENAHQVHARKKGGPYSKQDRQARRNEVFRLHFEYGYSAVKIADVMKVNRNTINNDINYLYSQMSQEWDNHDIQSWWMRQLHRLEMQRTRLREELDKETDFEKRLVLEKMIFDIDSKLLQMSIKTISTRDRFVDDVVKYLNNYAKENKINITYARSRDITRLQTRNHEKIAQIINKDRNNRLGR